MKKEMLCMITVLFGSLFLAEGGLENVPQIQADAVVASGSAVLISSAGAVSGGVSSDSTSEEYVILADQLDRFGGPVEATGEDLTVPALPTAKVGACIKDKKGNCYRITKLGHHRSVAFVKPCSRKCVVIPNTVKAGKKSYKVTAIASNAMKKNKTAEILCVGKNVKKIGNGAFDKCKLKQIVVENSKCSEKIRKQLDKKQHIKISKSRKDGSN